MTPGNRYTYIIFIDSGFILLQFGGSAKYFLFRYGGLAKIIIFCHRYVIYSFQLLRPPIRKVICIKIRYGCGHLGVATFAIEILRMSEIALDPHLDTTSRNSPF